MSDSGTRGTNLNGKVRPDVRLFDGLVRHRVVLPGCEGAGRA